MVNRRTLFASLPFLGTLPLFARIKPTLPEGHEILRSFDARDWAKAFVAHAEQLPGLATDEETMTTWFANALMRGYDEAHSRLAREWTEVGVPVPGTETYESVRSRTAS